MGGHQQPDHEVATAARGVFGDQGDGGGQQTAESQSGDEPGDAEHTEGGGHRTHGGGQGEHRGTADDHLLAADPVGDGARRQGAKQHAEGGIAAEVTGPAGAQPEVGVGVGVGVGVVEHAGSTAP
ncbi:hypothetical protein GCM10017744_097120 [Streptomyces antimycoticus]